MYSTRNTHAKQFVRVRGASDEHRHAILLALVARTFRKRTLVFCNTKVKACLVCFVGFCACLLRGFVFVGCLMADRLI